LEEGFVPAERLEGLRRERDFERSPIAIAAALLEHPEPAQACEPALHGRHGAQPQQEDLLHRQRLPERLAQAHLADEVAILQRFEERELVALEFTQRFQALEHGEHTATLPASGERALTWIKQAP